jgi:serine/threonine protein kinase
MSNLDVGPGAVFGGDFSVVRALRTGGMGAVYVAEQRSTGTLRALKVMQRELVSLPSFRERFEQEACIAAKIESDHVVQVIAAGVEEGLPWLAMELLKGVPLDDYLAARGPLPAGEVAFVFEQLCHALGAAHEHGIIHRDLKPANVFLAVRRAVGVSYTVKVLDFGIAKVLAEARTAKTAAVGTPLYMAPEQYEAGTVTPATDVWALGLIAFELLTGRSYWKTAKDGAATPASVMWETCLGELSAPSSRTAELGIVADLPEGFDQWFARCVERNPELRFHDASDAFTSLSSVLGPAQPSRDPLPTMNEEMARPRSNKTASMADAGTGVPVVHENGVAATESMEESRRSSGTRAMTTQIVKQQPQAAAAVARKPIVAKAAAPPVRSSRFGLYAAIAGLGALGVATFMMCGRPSPRGSSTSDPIASARTLPSSSAALASGDPTHFTSGTTINVDGRLLHENIVAGQRTETYVMLDLHGMDVAPKGEMPAHLSLVIDRSGSMKGGRLESAIKAATLAIQRLRDGDTISVVTFDDSAQTLVAPTKLDAATRPAVLATVSKLGLGGNTCMSCGLSMALAKLGTSTDVARRILLLSDGQANTGIKDVAGFQRLAQDAGKVDVNITTIGVGDDYDSKSLFAIAHESNGQHYFASSDAVLTTVFDGEAKAFSSIVATNAEATIRLPAGVRLITVLDRANTVEANGAETIVRVPLGQFTRNERKTVLVKVAIDPAGETLAPVSSVQLAFREAGMSTVFVKSMGTLSAPVGTAPPELDPVVEARVQRSETAAALLKANELLNAGKAAEATNILATQSSHLAAQKKKWDASPNKKPATVAVEKDIDAQQAAVDETKSKYEDADKASKTNGAPPAMATPTVKAAQNKAMEDAYKAGF